jgi:hypothetical protein
MPLFGLINPRLAKNGKTVYGNVRTNESGKWENKVYEGKEIVGFFDVNEKTGDIEMLRLCLSEKRRQG